MLPVLTAALAVPEDTLHNDLHRPAPHFSMGRHLGKDPHLAMHRTLHGHRPLVKADAKATTAGVEVDDELERSLASQLDGCQNVFVDAGANIGMHARFLFEPEIYPDSTFVQVFDEQFGPIESRRKTTCAIEFEPNPRHRRRHELLRENYAEVGWRVIYAPYGISDARSVLTFYAADGGRDDEWGFTTNKNEYENEYGYGVDEFNVTSIDFAAFLRHLQGRAGSASGHAKQRSRGAKGHEPGEPAHLGKVVVRL